MTNQQQQPQEAEKWRKKSWEFYHAQQFSESLQFAQKAATYFKKQEAWEQYVDCLHNWSKSLWKSGNLEAALSKAQETLKISREKLGELSLTTAMSYRNVGLILSSQSSFESACDCQKKSLHIRLQLQGEKHRETIKDCLNVAIESENMGNYDQAIHYSQQALDMQMKAHRKEKELELTAIALYNLGMNNYRMREYSLAIKHLQSCLKIQRQIFGETHSETANTYDLLGINYCFLAKYNKALIFHQKSLAIRQQLFGDNHLHIAASYSNFGNIYIKKGNYEKAIQYLHKSGQIKRQYAKDSPRHIAINHINLSAVYLLKGDYDKALDHAFKSLNIYTEALGSLHPENSKCLDNIGLAYFHKKEYEKALYYYRKALIINLQSFGELNPATAMTYNNIGKVYLRQEKYGEAKRYLTQSLDIKLQTLGEQHTSVVECHLVLGELFLQQSNYESSVQHYQKALDISLEVIGSKYPRSAKANLCLGRIQHQQKKYSSALAYFQTAINALYSDFDIKNGFVHPTFQHCLSLPVLLDILQAKSQTFYGKYLYETQSIKYLLAAQHSYHITTDLITHLRHSYPSEGSKLSLAEQALIVYEGAIQTALMLAQKCEETITVEALQNAHQELQSFNPHHQLPQPKEAKNLAFTYSEQSKAILLYSNLKDNAAKITANIPEDLLQKEYDLRIELNYLDQQIAQEQIKPLEEKEESYLLQLQNQRFDYKQEYEALIAQFERDYPEYFQLKYNTSTATVSDVQHYLQEQIQSTAFIAYFVGEKQLTIFCITSNEYTVQQIERPVELIDNIADFQEAINMAELEDFVEMSTKLYAVLLKPIEKQLEEAERLIIVRDDVLHYLAFEALLTEDMEERLPKSRFADLPYLLQQFEVSYHYSATLLLHQSNLPQLTHETSFIGFAPITFDKTEIVSTELALESTKGRTVVLRSNRAGETALQTLPNTENEVKNVYQLFENQCNSAKVFLYGAASKQNLQEYGVQSKFLLIATHGLVNEQSEHLSGIYLAKVEKEAPSLKEKKEMDSIETVDNRKANSLQSDYVLSVAETYHLKMNTDLLVLSSCSSGIGTLQKGEGMMAINRAFLYAGARNIIFTQFDIPDKSSSELVVSLFEEVLEEKEYASALRKAKLKLIQNPRKSPQDWAGFVLIGGK